MKEQMTGKTDQELVKEVEGTREELRRLRFDLAAGKVKNVKAVRASKKRIARKLTELRSRTA